MNAAGLRDGAPAAPECRRAGGEHVLALLERVEGWLARQREALVAGETAEVEQLSHALGHCLPRVTAAQADGEPRTVALARRVREQVRLNLVLLANGMEAADRFARAVAEDGSSEDGVFISGSG